MKEEKKESHSNPSKTEIKDPDMVSLSNAGNLQEDESESDDLHQKVSKALFSLVKSSSKNQSVSYEDVVQHLQKAGLNDEEGNGLETAIEIFQNLDIDIKMPDDESESDLDFTGSHTTDPVKLYMRSISKSKLLTREEEIDLGKKIEQNYNMALTKLFEIPCALNILCEKFESFLSGEILMRDAIDVESIYNREFRPNANQNILEKQNERYEGHTNYQSLLQSKIEQARSDHSDMSDMDESDLFGEIMDVSDDDMSISQMEAALSESVSSVMSKILNRSLNIIKTRKDQLFGIIDQKTALEKIEPILESVLKDSSNIKINQNIFSSMMGRVDELSKQISKFESTLFLLAESVKISRKDFFEFYNSLDKNSDWIKEIENGSQKKDGQPWKELLEKHQAQILGIKKSLAMIEQKEALLDIKEFKKLCIDAQSYHDAMIDAKKQLIESNSRLVVSIAKRYMHRGLHFADLIQEGNIGLMKAVDKFEYMRGHRLGTYGGCWIKQVVMRALADYGRIIRRPVHVIDRTNRIHRYMKNYKNAYLRDPTIAEIAAAFQVSEEKIRQTLSITKEPLSMDFSLGDSEDSGSIGDIISSPDTLSPFEEAVKYVASKDLVAELGSTLFPREETVVRCRFGIENTIESTLQFIGMEIGVTRERVRQIEAKALRKLQNPNKYSTRSGRKMSSTTSEASRGRKKNANK